MYMLPPSCEEVNFFEFFGRMDSNNSAPKRCRASAEQLHYIVDFMDEQKGLAGGKFQKMHGKLETQKKWTELATNLNSLSGAMKSVDQWRTVWRDLKSRTSNKVRDRKRQQALTGNKPVTVDPLTHLDELIISLIGNEYIEGSEAVAENVPEIEEDQLLLEDGDDSAFNRLISTPTLKQEFPKSPAKSTPHRSRKQKRSNEEEVQEKFLKIAEQQADALKLLAETNAANGEAMKKMAEPMTILGEGLKHVGDAFNNLAQSINHL